VGKLATKWQDRFGDNNLGSTSPVLAAGTLYFGTPPDMFSGVLNAVNASTGDLI
jgi:outer membrane protein assembly factor BamB